MKAEKRSSLFQELELWSPSPSSARFKGARSSLSSFWLPFEGQRVSVTVIASEKAPVEDTGDADERLPSEPLYGPDESVILEDLGRIPVTPRHLTTYKAHIVDIVVSRHVCTRRMLRIDLWRSNRTILG